MSFDRETFKETLAGHYMARLGWPEVTANRAAAIAVDVIMLTHGGERHYIQQRQTDKQAIAVAKAKGDSIEKIAREQAVSSRTVLRVLHKIAK